jgi:hypothetical protein
MVALLGAEYAICDGTTVTAQYRIHENPLRNGNIEADKTAQLIELGFHRRVADGVIWSGGFSEDFYPETAPDFVVFSEVKWEF